MCGSGRPLEFEVDPGVRERSMRTNENFVLFCFFQENKMLHMSMGHYSALHTRVGRSGV